MYIHTSINMYKVAYKVKCAKLEMKKMLLFYFSYFRPKKQKKELSQQRNILLNALQLTEQK